MTHMAEKLIHDGKETRRAKLNLISISIGAVLLSELVLIIYA